MTRKASLGNIVLYEVLGWYGIPGFYDKLLPVPLMMRDDILSVIPGTLGEAALIQALDAEEA